MHIKQQQQQKTNIAETNKTYFLHKKGCLS